MDRLICLPYISSFSFPFVAVAFVYATSITTDTQASYTPPARSSDQDRLGTPLHVSIWCNQPSAFELLLIRSADINILDEGGELHSESTPIQLAVCLERRAMVKRLWKMGAERDKRPEGRRWGASLVRIAAFEGHGGVLRDLLSWDESWTQEERVLALDRAGREWHIDAVAALLAACRFNTTCWIVEILSRKLRQLLIVTIELWEPRILLSRARAKALT